jgi:para-nitrobenzyl esterase
VRDASEFGPCAPQAASLDGLAFSGPEGQSEDCLNLNVWTTGFEAPTRPVMVWVHGGGFTTGSGSGALFRGGRLAKNTGVVVVTFNYRLGALGFLAHPALADGGALGNYGLLDQIAALEWVRDNIATFGGDPANVTIFGESAGAMSISALLGIPKAQGLFHRAIIESGPPYTHSAERAERAAMDLAHELGLSTIDRSTFESIPADDFVAATRVLQARTPDPGEITLPFLPTIDGHLLPDSPTSMVAGGSASSIPLMIGTNRDEMTLFAAGDPRLSGIDDSGLAHWTSRAAPSVDAGALIESYRSARAERGESTDARHLWVAIGTDVVFRWKSLQFAAAHHAHQANTYVYLFVWESPAFGGVLGSSHGLEIPFVFGSVEHPAVAAFVGDRPETLGLSTRMQSHWNAFARTGEPVNDFGGDWPIWDPITRSTMVFGPTSEVVQAPRNAELAVLEQSEPLLAPSGVSDS